jgi:hypothetical protein
MKRFALIQGGIVANVVEQDDTPQISGEWIACDNAGPGWTYDGSAFAEPVLAPTLRHITQLAFLTRFTDDEAIAIDLASIGATTQAASIRRYSAKVNAAKYIDLDLAETRAGVQSLEANGLLAVGRAAVILDSVIQTSEKP